MESANLHHQQEEEVQFVESSSPPPPPLPIASSGAPSYSYGAPPSNHAWSTPNIFLNASANPNVNGASSSFNSSEGSRASDDFTPQHHISITQNSGFPWSTAKIKEELSISTADSNFPKFTDIGIDHTMSLNADLSEKLLLKTITASTFHFNGHDHHHHLGDPHFYSNPSFGRSGSFSHIYPSINVSNLNQSNSAPAFTSSSSLDMNLQALDLLTNARFSGSIGHQPSDDHQNLEMFKDGFVGFDHQQMHHESLPHRSSCSPSKVQLSGFPKGAATEAKRGSSLGEPSHTPKKSKLDPRPSCPPLKVRKEKLGDRIAALQQLVAPFGKTDTASVLMEAIGYIQFLQNQVKTLSVPYMKSWRNKPCSTTMQGGLSEEGNEERRRDLRSRGLCLVPLSCMSYVANVDGGGCDGVWPPPPNFR